MAGQMLLLAMLFGAFDTTQLAPSACSVADADAADRAIEGLKTWADVYGFFRRYGQCDDGGIGESLSDVIPKMLADHWEQVGDLAGLMSRNPRFREFVLRHINSLCRADVFDRLVANAAVRCPTNAQATCATILRWCRDLEREFQQARAAQ